MVYFGVLVRLSFANRFLIPKIREIGWLGISNRICTSWLSLKWNPKFINTLSREHFRTDPTLYTECFRVSCKTKQKEKTFALVSDIYLQSIVSPGRYLQLPPTLTRKTKSNR